MKTLYEITGLAASVPQAVYAADATTNGTAVDLGGLARGYRSALVIAVAGPVTDGSYAVSLQHSDNNSAWTAVPADKLQGSFAAITAAGIQSAGYHGGKRYLRAVMVATATTLGATVGVLVVPGFGSDVRA